MYLYTYLFNVYLFCTYSCFIEMGAEFKKCAIILAFKWIICLCNFEFIQYILIYKCIFLVYSFILYKQWYRILGYSFYYYFLSANRFFIIKTLCGYPGVCFVHLRNSRNKCYFQIKFLLENL